MGARKPLTSEEWAERVKALTDQLEAGIAELFTSDRYMAYLQAMSKFHRYSYGNIMLILWQRPSASRVAGFQKWKQFGRHVKAKEHGIQILAPCPYQSWEKQDKVDPVSQRPVIGADGRPVQEWVRVERRGYKIEYVYDITQTEGREMPEIVCELSGDVEQYEAICAALRELSPVPIEFGPLPEGVKGKYSHTEQKITIRPDMSQKQTLKTMIHEIAHSILHALPVENGIITGVPDKSRPRREVEAESVAYVVCQHFGIDTSDYTFGYVAGWSRDKDQKVLRESLDCIRSTAAQIIKGIEEKCPELAPPEPEQAGPLKHTRRPAKRRPVRQVKAR